MTDYGKMKRDELMRLAKAAKLRGRGRMTKGQLAEALAALSAPSGTPTPASAAPPSPPPGPAPQARPPADAQLPRYLGEDRACLLPQNPRTAFLYWEVSPERIAAVLRECGAESGSLILRVYEADGGARLLESHPLGDRLGSWYVHLDRSGMDIWAEIGLEAAGRYVVLLSTNRVRLPRDTPSEDVDGLWMTRRRHLEEVFRLSGGVPGPGSSARSFPGPGGLPEGSVSSWPGGKKERGR